MCTVVVLFRPGHAWPMLLAANRDERLDRAWDAPGEWWPEYSGVIGGRDRTAGGTWMAMQGGRVVAVLNRPGSLGPALGKRSRGELPLLALAGDISALSAGAYRPFNLIIASRDGAQFVRGDGFGRPHIRALPPGLSVVTAHDPNDPASPRAMAQLPRFKAAPAPEPPDWSAWTTLLLDQSGERGAALYLRPESGFGTVCSSLLGLPEAGSPVWLFNSGRSTFVPVPSVVKPVVEVLH